MENALLRALRTRPDWQLLSALALALILFKSWLTAAAGLEMHFDEAQYWEWSQQLDWSYYSKGPLIAWLIALSERLFGHGEWQTRLFGWLAHAGLLGLVFYFARDVWASRRVGWWAVIIILFTPLYFTLSLAMTTDTLLFFFWTWGLWALWRALVKEAPFAWYEAGAAVGLGALTKLSIGLLPATVGLLILAQPGWWHHLRSKHLWLALLLMLACMSPVLLWNAAHDWVMLRHEQGHVAIGDWSLLSAVEFLVQQWLVLSPIIATLAITLLWRRPRERQHFFVWILGLAWIGFFLCKAIGGKVQINWPAPSYIGLIILFAGHIPQLDSLRRRILYAGLIFSVALMSVAYFPQLLGLKGRLEPFKKNKYWREPIEQIARRSPPADFILTDTYYLAAELAYYWPQSLPLYITGSASRRFNQHDLWADIARERGRNALYIIEEAQPNPLLKEAFGTCTGLPALAVSAWDGSVVRTLHPYYCEGYRAIEWPLPQGY